MGLTNKNKNRNFRSLFNNPITRGKAPIVPTCYTYGGYNWNGGTGTPYILTLALRPLTWVKAPSKGFGYKGIKNWIGGLSRYSHYFIGRAPLLPASLGYSSTVTGLLQTVGLLVDRVANRFFLTSPKGGLEPAITSYYPPALAGPNPVPQRGCCKPYGLLLGVTALNPLPPSPKFPFTLFTIPLYPYPQQLVAVVIPKPPVLVIPLGLLVKGGKGLQYGVSAFTPFGGLEGRGIETLSPEGIQCRVRVNPFSVIPPTGGFVTGIKLRSKPLLPFCPSLNPLLGAKPQLGISIIFYPPLLTDLRCVIPLLGACPNCNKLLGDSNKVAKQRGFRASKEGVSKFGLKEISFNPPPPLTCYPRMGMSKAPSKGPNPFGVSKKGDKGLYPRKGARGKGGLELRSVKTRAGISLYPPAPSPYLGLCPLPRLVRQKQVPLHDVLGAKPQLHYVGVKRVIGVKRDCKEGVRVRGLGLGGYLTPLKRMPFWISRPFLGCKSHNPLTPYPFYPNKVKGKGVKGLAPQYFLSDFVDIQRKSFFTLLEKGLIEEFSKRNPITNTKKTMELLFYPEYYQLTPPEYTPSQAIIKSKSYTSRLYIPVQLTDKTSNILKLKWVYIGNIPLMTKRGHFILNGCARVIVNQMIRSPGIYFQNKTYENYVDKWSEKPDTTFERYYADLICNRGTWLRIEIDKYNRIWAQMKRVPKIPIMWFLIAMGLPEKMILKRIIDSQMLLYNLQEDPLNPQRKVLQYIKTPPAAWAAIYNLISPKKAKKSMEKSLIPFLPKEQRGIKSPALRGTANPHTGITSISLSESPSDLKSKSEKKAIAKKTALSQNNKALNIHTFITPTQDSAVTGDKKLGKKRSAGNPNVPPKVIGESTKSPKSPSLFGVSKEGVKGISLGLKGKKGFSAVTPSCKPYGLQQPLTPFYPLYPNFIPCGDLVQYPSPPKGVCPEGKGVRNEVIIPQRGITTNPFGVSILGALPQLRGSLGDSNKVAKQRGTCYPSGITSEGGIKKLGQVPAQSELGRKWFFNKFMNPRTYDLGKVGRLNFNSKLKLAISLNQTTLTPQDLLLATDYLILVSKGLREVDDIDHLKNRRVRTSGELIQLQIGIGLVRLEKNIREKMNKIQSQLLYRIPASGFTKQVKKVLGTEIQSTSFIIPQGGISKGVSKKEFSYPSGIASKEGDLGEGTIASPKLVIPPGGLQVKGKELRSAGDSKKSLAKAELANKTRITQTIVSRSFPNKKMATNNKTRTKNYLAYIEKLTISTIMNTKPFNGALKEFFGSSPLSQFMDQINPLAELTHKRRLSSMGPGGVTRDSATLEIRGIHPSHYGRICPVETPEGKNTGLVNSLTAYARVNSDGYIETPFYRVYKGQVQKKTGLFFFSAKQEEKIKLGAADLYTTDIGFLPLASIPARIVEDFTKISRNAVQYVGVAPIQMISIATSLIPFFEHDDGNRALMGSNMQRQAVPILKPQRPIVGTGLEARAVSDSGHVIQAKYSGVVTYVSSNKIRIYCLE